MRLATFNAENLFTRPSVMPIKLNEIRNQLASRKGGKTTIVPSGRGGWVRFFELVRGDLSGDEVAP